MLRTVAKTFIQKPFNKLYERANRLTLKRGIIAYINAFELSGTLSQSLLLRSSSSSGLRKYDLFFANNPYFRDVTSPNGDVRIGDVSE